MPTVRDNSFVPSASFETPLYYLAQCLPYDYHVEGLAGKALESMSFDRFLEVLLKYSIPM